MLDTSDGLADASRLLAEASGVRVVVDEDRLADRPRPPRGGRESGHRVAASPSSEGDYELLAAVPAGSVDRAIQAVRAAGGRVTVVGTVATGRGAFLRSNGREIPMPRAGWRPFRRSTAR